MTVLVPTRYLRPTMKKLVLKAEPIDAVGAIVGSTTNCTWCRTGRRQINNLTRITVYPNHMTLSTIEHIYHFSTTNKALSLIGSNDEDKVILEKPVTIVSDIIGKPQKKKARTEEQKEAIRNRVRIGRSEGRYVNNVRVLAARKAGKKAGQYVTTPQQREIEAELEKRKKEENNE